MYKIPISLTSFSDSKHALAIFFDLNKAFDTAWRHSILSTFSGWGINGKMLAFIKNFLSNRCFQVSANGCTSTVKSLENGTPQGSVLSTTLFNIAINDVTRDIRAPIKTTLYADDLTLFIKGNDIISSKNLMQRAIDSLELWSRTTGFCFSPEKTKCVIFSKRKKIQPPEITLYHKILSFCDEIKYLGIIFDSKLNWQNHITYLRKECCNRIRLLKMLVHQHWGADTTILLRLYKILIRSKLDYGATAYASAKPHILNKLNPIQNTSIRTALGAYCTTPVESLYALSDIPSLEARRSELILPEKSN
ncbi:RNA-directed DNA polymerase from mobile element jockey-like Protein [Tribolium castaneum]|uniref:RNA-directed DNA polymerase from mobile element jockey-like Protein n=1 Tax=Tribolium castaneum TaxID=7070 RepID=A0A139W8H3_TRICA|nr:RNA-directed DNA polymerase from mobile element jockey-like Protein [Tribolium castaneum]